MPPRDSAGGIVLGSDGKMVLVNQGSNVWSFPKGGVEQGETLLEAAKREIGEECGITDLTLVEELGSYKRRMIGKGGIGEVMDRPESTRTLFLFTTSQTEITPQDGEIVAVRWVSIDEALELLTHLKDKEFLVSVRDKIEKWTHSH
ncbi:MAG TPA: NUDIX hydrolase [Candidatus Paceibacterota bacterium]|nr:NUDIX hydrolase [Candidatus Paceibacterota bacterium]